MYATAHIGPPLTKLLQKFKVRIEDPPRRRHMVFLGGAVLANIVSCLQQECRGYQLTMIRWQTRKICGSQNRSGRSRARGHWRNLVRDEVVIANRGCYLAAKSHSKPINNTIGHKSSMQATKLATASSLTHFGLQKISEPSDWFHYKGRTTELDSS
jgi:hypothetical protein